MDLSERRRKIGNKIRELRERESWNQKKLGVELAKILGKPEPVASATISRYEEGKRSVKSEILQALGGIFEVKSSFFYEGENLISEPRADYDAGINTKKLSVIEDIPASFPDVEEKHIAGFAQFPRFLFPGAQYIIKVNDSFSCGNEIREGDHILVAPFSGESAGKKLLYKNEGIFFVGPQPKKSMPAEIVGLVVGVINKP